MSLTPERQAELNELLAEHNKMNQQGLLTEREKEEVLRKTNRLKVEEIEHMLTQRGLADETVARLQTILELKKQEREIDNDSVEKAQERLNIIKQMQDFKGKGLMMAQAERDLGRQILKDAQDRLDALESAEIFDETAIKNARLAVAEAEKQKDALDKSAQHSEAIARSFEKDLVPGMKKANEFGGQLAKAFQEGPMRGFSFALREAAFKAKEIANTFANNFTGGMELSLMGLLTKLIQMGFELDKTIKQFERSTQLGKDFSNSMLQTAESTAKFGVSMEEASKAHMDLIQNSTEFTLATRQQRDALANTAAVMGELGIATKDFATGIQNSMKFFSESMEQAEETQRELLAVAKELKVIPGELSAAFAQMGPRLAKFGKQGIDTFKELARVSKITGMEMEKILNLTDQFDTFEGAAEQVGKINAALGGNFVNAMEMMTATDPAERFNMMRDALSSAGLSFDSMSYYQKKFFAESMGLSSVGDLALMMSGNMDALGGATEKSAEEYAEMARQAQIVQSVQEKFNAVIANFFMENKDQIMEIIDKLGTFLQMLLENADKIATYAKALVVLKLASFGFGFATQLSTASLAANTVAAGANTTAFGFMTFATAVDTSATKIGAGVKFLFANAMNAARLAAIGLRFALVGLALFGLVLLAQALMMESPSKLVMALFALAGALTLLTFVAKPVANKLKPLTKQLDKLGNALLKIFIPLTAILLAMGQVSAGAYAGAALLLTAIAYKGQLAAAGLRALAKGLKALGKVVATGKGALGLAAVIAVIHSLAFAAKMAGPALTEMFKAFLMMPPEELYNLSKAVVVFAAAMFVMMHILKATAKLATKAAKGLAIMMAVLLVIGITVDMVGRGMKAMAEAFDIVFASLNEQNIALFADFAAHLSYAWVGMTLTGAALIILSVGLVVFAGALALVNAEKLRSIADFALGMGEIGKGGGFRMISHDLEQFGIAMELLAEKDLESPFTELNTALGLVDADKIENISTMMALVSSLETTGLTQLAEAFELIAESIDKIPEKKAVALTATMKSATVTAKAIEVLQGRGGAAAAAAGVGGGREGSGQVATSSETKREFKVDFHLDSDVFEEHVITIIDNNVGKKTLEAIRKER